MSEEKDIKKKAEDEQQNQDSVSDFETNEDENWEEVSEGKVVKLEVNQHTQGTLISKDLSRKYNTGIYKIQSDDGGPPQVLIGSKMLDRIMDQIEIGTRVKIQRLPDTPTDKGNPMHVFKVFTQKE
jgi:hypothetical protein